MLPAAQIPIGVSTQDCLSWSSDGALAIAAYEEVYLLLPRSEGPEPWAHVHFRVNTFSHDEWPVRPQASFANMSIGEEQGRVSVATLDWSPPGLVKHRRSILAVLTTNLILSLWVPGPDPRDSQGWKRICIVNKATIPQSISPNGIIRSLGRIRSMAWVPPNGEHADQKSPFSTRKWGIPLLAVADDNNALCILAICSPFTSATLPWDVQVLAYKAVTSPLAQFRRHSLLAEALNAKNFIDHIFIMDWDSAGELPITVRSSGVFFQTRLNVCLGPPLGVTLTDFQVNEVDAGKHYTLPRPVPRFIQASMERHKAKYSSDNHLDLDDVVMKTWGSGSSENLGAVCVTCHPARMVEYQAPAAESATIIFAGVDIQDASQRHDKFPWQSVPRVDPTQARQTVISTILDPSTTSQTFDQSLKLSRFDLKIIYTAIMASLILSIELSQQRSSIDHLEAALVILEHRSGIPLQLERTLITSFKSSSEDHESLVNEWAQERSQNGFGQMVPGVQLLDNCPFCSDKYYGLAGGLAEFTEAHCPNNHPYGMTSVQSGGI